jgi:hypothetical protein
MTQPIRRVGGSTRTTGSDRIGAKRLAVSLLLGVTIAACGGTPATPAGSSAPTPRSTPALSPAPTAVASETAAPDPSPHPTAAASGLPAGWHHNLVCSEDGTGCQLHLYDAAGREQPWWPVALVGGCWPENLAVGTDGVAYIACYHDQQVIMNAVDAGGASVPGWPIRTTGYPLRVVVGRDGTAYLGTVEPEAFNLDLSFRVLFMVIIGGVGTVLGAFLGAGFVVLMPVLLSVSVRFLDQTFGLGIAESTISNLELMVFGGLIIFFLIVEPHGLARLWQITKEKLRLWPFPH